MAKEKPLTQTQIHDYIENPYHCPVCNADIDNIDWGMLDAQDEFAVRNCVCKRCGAEFDEILSVTGVELTNS